jgi:uncharacterized membrane protein YbhN (UPF0104 family)
VATRAGFTFDAFQALDLSGWSLNWPLIALSSLVLLVGYFLTGITWALIVTHLGGGEMPVGASIRVFMIANLGRYVPGKVWQIAGLAVLAKEMGVAPQTAAAAAILGQGVALVAATLIGLDAAGMLLSVPDQTRWIILGAVLGSVFLGLLPPVFRAATGLWFRLARTPAPEGLQPSRALVWLGLGIANWLLFAGAFWLLVRGLGLETALIPTASAFAAAYVFGYVMIFAPAGIGVREASLITLLTPQIGPGAAGAVAVVARLWTTVIEVVPAATFWVRHLTSPDRAPKPRA